MGAVVRANGGIHHTLSGAYEAVDAASLIDQAEQILMLSSTLDAGEGTFQTVFLEYDQHSVFARQMDHGILVLLTAPMQRAGFKKVQVGVNLFMKQLNTAIDTALGPATPSPSPSPLLREGLRIDPADARPRPEKPADERAEAEADTAEERPRKKRYYRGVAY
ncbi:MAG: hypothetical protein AAFY59_00505 [Pseudomonadota bacterium]